MHDNLTAELRENSRRYARNVAELKSALYELGDEPAPSLDDWDWRWPQNVELEAPLRTCFDAVRCKVDPTSQLGRLLLELYQVLLDQPPRLERWAVEWSGNDNRFYIFMFDKLDDLVANVERRTARLEVLIHELPESVNVSHP
jgi:hypothetical protein